MLPPFMFLPAGQFTLGAVHCAWRPHRHGTSVEPLVRAWLAQPLGAEAAAFVFARSARGRPSLAAPHAGIDVNWSHSGDGLLMAFGAGVQVGVDLELLRPRPRALELARRFFTAQEADALASLPDTARERAFVRLWCAKEALLKAHGHGLSFGLDRLEFALQDDTWALVDCDPALGAPADWTLHAFVPGPHYLATIAWRPAIAGAHPGAT
jgi:4'-phosphopantetheinyl transferase